MILIADSGSTKTDWALLQHKEVVSRIRTAGLNPNTTSAEQCTAIIREVELFTKHAAEVQQVYFYGAGCAGAVQQQMMVTVLSDIFAHAHIKVESDLVGAVHAVATSGEPSIIGILGTGANSCYFDGTVISGDAFSLGYILGDEGSGSWLGKLMLTAFWYGEMPERLQRGFAEQFSITRDDILKGVYHSGAASAYLASFATFAVANRTDPFIRNLIDIGFSLFIKRYLKRFPHPVPVYMIGGIACALEEEFRQNAQRHQLQTGVFLQEPLTGLIEKLK